jgi:hypothetical protein
MKRFAPFFVVLLACFTAAPLQAAPGQHPPVDTIVVDRFTNANGMAQSPDFSHFFADYVSEQLAKGNVAIHVVDQGTPVPDSSAANSLVIDGKFLSHENAGLVKPGKLIVEISIYRLSDRALVRTLTPATHFPPNGDHKDRVYAYYTGTGAADAISDALRSIDLSSIPPAAPGSSPAASASAPTAPSSSPAAPSPAPAPPSDAAPSNTVAPAGPDAVASVQLSSDPTGAEITIDGNYMGNTPSLIKLRPGTHSIRMTLPGYAPWVRSIETAAGESRNFAATLEKTNP